MLKTSAKHNPDFTFCHKYQIVVFKSIDYEFLKTLSVARFVIFLSDTPFEGTCTVEI